MTDDLRRDAVQAREALARIDRSTERLTRLLAENEENRRRVEAVLAMIEAEPKSTQTTGV